jgi:hypothetical protein
MQVLRGASVSLQLLSALIKICMITAGDSTIRCAIIWFLSHFSTKRISAAFTQIAWGFRLRVLKFLSIHLSIRDQYSDWSYYKSAVLIRRNVQPFKHNLGYSARLTRPFRNPLFRCPESSFSWKELPVAEHFFSFSGWSRHLEAAFHSPETTARFQATI